MVSRMRVLLVMIGCGLTLVSADPISAESVSHVSGLKERTIPGAIEDRKTPASAAFARMPLDQIQSELLQWMARAKVEAGKAREITALWADRQRIESMTAEQTLDRLIESFALADEAVEQLLAAGTSSAMPPSIAFEGDRSDAFFKDHVQLHQARWLTQHRFYDEGLVILESLDPETVVDPASLFFYRAVCHLKLLNSEKAADDISLLLNNTVDVPARFRAVAELMKTEAQQTADGLPQVARLMSDVQRRLDLGKSNEPVQQREEEVIAALDKILEEMEKQKKQQQQGGQGTNNGDQSQPGQQGATQSTIKGSAADGEADRKELKEGGSWGMVNKEAETKARELIRQQFPPNFLDAISRYTRKIAEQKE